MKLQHKKLQTRCESAANKAGGSPPKVLARVLACCGRFIELLHPEGAQRMERLRQVEAASRERCGLEAMREALAATSAAAEPAPMDVGKASVPNLTLTHPHPPSPGSGGGAYRAALEKAPVVAQGGGDGEKTSRYMAMWRRGWRRKERGRKQLVVKACGRSCTCRRTTGWSSETVWPAGSQNSLRVCTVLSNTSRPATSSVGSKPPGPSVLAVQGLSSSLCFSMKESPNKHTTKVLGDS